jgi:hypothetical protein
MPQSTLIKAAHQDRRASHAVGVVVAINGDLALGLDRGMQPLGGRARAGKQLRIAQMVELGFQEDADFLRPVDSAVPEELRDHRRHPSGELQL